MLRAVKESKRRRALEKSGCSDENKGRTKLLNKLNYIPILPRAHTHCLPFLSIFSPLFCYLIFSSFCCFTFLPPPPPPFFLSVSVSLSRADRQRQRDCCCACSLTLSAHKSLSTACMSPLLPPCPSLLLPPLTGEGVEKPSDLPGKL